jgi:hypothetical protein
MAETGELLGIYLHLARASEARRRPLVRDKLLVLAGAVAAERGMAPLAAYCRQKVLASNRGHLVGHHPTLAAALEDERFQRYLARLRKHYSRERAEYMLSSLGIDLARERAAYFDDYEYAAAVLGTTPEALESQLAAAEAALPPAETGANPYAAPQSHLAAGPRRLVPADRWLAPATVTALVILPLLLILLALIAQWLGAS